MAFLQAFSELSRRINRLLAVPIDERDRQALAQRLREIGSTASQ